MQSEYKYYRIAPIKTRNTWLLRKPEKMRIYDNMLIDVIDNKMMLSDAHRKQGLSENTAAVIIKEQRALGVVIPSIGFKPNAFDPNGPYKYWVVPATHEELQTKDYGQMMDTLIQQHIDGESLEILSERYGLPYPTVNANIKRCRKAGAPIPNLPARAKKHKDEINPDLFEFVNGHNQVKPSIVQEWVKKRLEGYPATWIGGEYRIAGWTVTRLTKPFLPADFNRYAFRGLINSGKLAKAKDYRGDRADPTEPFGLAHA